MNSIQKNLEKGIVWKKGVTDFETSSVHIDNVEVKILEGQAYLIDHSKNTYLELSDPSYTDFAQYKDFIILSTFVKIEIYQLMDFKAKFEIDDIDGIKLNKVTSGILDGKFNQIEDRDFDHWIDFKVDLSSLDLFCDHGRMWSQTTEENGTLVESYKTMDLKK